MDGNVFRRDAGDARRRHLVHGLELGSGPDLAAAVGEAHRAVERLHRRVREVGDVVFSNHTLGGMGERFFRISLLRGHGALGLRLRAVALEELRAIDVGARPRIPVDHEGIATELGAPEVARDDSDAGWHLHHLLDALDRLGLARVERLDLPSEDGRSRDERGPQVGHADVHPELRLPGDLLRRVEAPGGLADDLPALAVLQLHALRRRLGLGSDSELPIGEAIVAAQHEAVLRSQPLRVRLPLRCRRPHQHRARHGACGAIALELRPGGGRAARHLHPERRVRVDGSGGSVLDADPRPVAVQLLGDEHGEPGPDPLAHLGVGEQHRHRFVGRDADERVRIGRRFSCWLRHRACLARYVEGDEQARPGKERFTEQLAAREGDHRSALLFDAALRTASRMRWYVPHRQMLPAMARSIS